MSYEEHADFAEDHLVDAENAARGSADERFSLDAAMVRAVLALGSAVNDLAIAQGTEGGDQS